MRTFAKLAASATLIAVANAFAQAAPTPTLPAGAPASKLFAVEIMTGPNWDKAKPPQEQAQFKEHSAHLRKLREEGHIRMGARYAEKGLIVLSAAAEADARSLMDADPSMQSGTFRYSLAEMRVFYPGQVGAERPPVKP